MEKSEKTTLIATIVLVGFVFGVIFHYILGFYLHLKYPYNTFLFNPDIFVTDFTNLVIFSKDFAPFKTPSIWVNYFPLAYIFLYPFSLINSLVSYLIFLPIFLSFWFYINIKNLSCNDLTNLQNIQNIFIICAISYPFLVLIDRGNFDMILLLLLAAFIYLFKSKKFFLSSLLLGVVNALKPFSLIFLFLFVFEKKWKELILSFGLSILLIIGGFLLLKGDFFQQVSTYIINIRLFNEVYVFNINEGIQNCSSLFLALKFLLCKSTNLIPTYALVKIYFFINIISAVSVLFFAWREKIFWKKISLFFLYMLLIPYAIYDYKLIFLFIPIWLFVNAEETTRLDLIYSILFGLLLIPKRFLFLCGLKQFLCYPLSVIINPLIMLIFMGLIIYEQIATNKGFQPLVCENSGKEG